MAESLFTLSLHNSRICCIWSEPVATAVAATQLRSGFRTESFGSPRPCLCRFFFPTSRRRGGPERVQKARGGRGDLIDRGVKGGFVRFGRFVEAAHLAHELERGSPDFFVGDRRVETERHLDIAVHGLGPQHKLKHHSAGDVESSTACATRRIVASSKWRPSTDRKS